MGDTITIYTEFRLDRRTGEITKSHPVELTEYVF